MSLRNNFIALSKEGKSNLPTGLILSRLWYFEKFVINNFTKLQHQMKPPVLW